MEFIPNSEKILVAGSYDGYVQMFSMNQMYSTHCFKCQKTGITNVKVSICRNYLFTSARKNDNILCWDLRYLPIDINSGTGKYISIYKQKKK